MKKFIIAALLLAACSAFSLQFTIDNKQIDFHQQDTYTKLQTQNNTIYNLQPGAPAIPQINCWLELPEGFTAKSVNVTPQDITEQKIHNQLFPVQNQSAFSGRKPEFTKALPQYYEQEVFPENWLSNWSTQTCGSHNLLNITLSAAAYYPLQNSIKIPDNFVIDVTTAIGEMPVHVDNQVVSDVLSELGLPARTQRNQLKYLVIAPMMFLNALQPLLDWRSAQGFEVYTRTTGEISTQYPGEDLAAQIRACLSDMQQNYGIDYVTLAGDHQHIPARFAWAFDCQYGAHDDENNLACDMYYSCLDGNWNADADSLYGEDEDEVDLLPEVYVGRIPVNTASELNGYINKLMVYEQGQIADYNRAGGLSMELWDGAQSELCQQYIYENYFPHNYQINLLYGDDNNEENAFSLISEGYNIIQHTGHAWINVLSLENYGHIYLSDVDDLLNEWGGLFYSIGCWSNSFNDESIGETFVREPQRNFLGYIGNSSYGWGAPSAAGFGFSEFYQREFFRLLFDSNQNYQELGKMQALQKLPFLPYFAGTSIYKWVGYELNLCGDAAARLFTDNPAQMNVFGSHIEDNLYLEVKTATHESIAGAVISLGENTWVTGADGLAVLPWDDSAEHLYSVYAPGYAYQEFDTNEAYGFPILQINNSSDFIEQNTPLSLEMRVNNPLDTEILFQVAAFAQPDIIEFSYDFDHTYTVPPHSELQLSDLILELADPQAVAGSFINIDIELHYVNITFPTVGNLTLQVQNPQFHLIDLNWDQSSFAPGAQLPLSFRFCSQYQIENIDLLQLELSSQLEEYLEFDPPLIISELTQLAQGYEFEFSTCLNLAPDLPQDIFTEAQAALLLQWDTHKSWEGVFKFYLASEGTQIYQDFESELTWNGDPAWQTVDTYSSSGEFSLSCRPQETGNYLLSTPQMTWLPGTELSFWYRSKMPMYGQDGVYIRLIAPGMEELIIFLGSGGALADTLDRPVPHIYLESPWVYYEFNLDEILLNTPDISENYHLEFDFNFSEVIEGFSQYDLMEDIGVFIDDLTIRPAEFAEHQNDQIPSALLNVYPNPLFAGDARSCLNLSFSLDYTQMVNICLYDIRGRKQQQIFCNNLGPGAHQLTWNPHSELPAGVYFIKLHTPAKTSFRKFLFLR